MKLLFDQNFSLRLRDLLSNSSHVFWPNLDQAEDVEVREYTRRNGYMVATNEADFSELTMLQGLPPRVIWFQLGNRTTGQVDRLLRLHHQAVKQLVESESIGILSLL